MDLPSKAIIDVLIYLFPGLVAASTYVSLTAAPKRSPFELIVQALIYTLVVQVLLITVRAPLYMLGSHVWSIGAWTSDVALVWSLVLALLLGVVTAWASNCDLLHKRLRARGITFQTSYPSEWYGAFSQNDGYVVLHLSGLRRLYGWAEEWPSDPDKGHFVVAQAEWLTEEGPIKLDQVSRILIKASDVQMVEMMAVQTSSPGVENG